MYSELFKRDVPRLGFGCMRLPEGQDGEYIEEECQEMFDYAMAHGINYFDSAWHYIESQLMIGKCLEKYPRESYILVGKLFFNDGTIGTWEKAEEAFQRELNDARTTYNDLELMHAMGSEESVRRIDAMDAWGFMRKIRDEGRAKHIGISFHGSPEMLDHLLASHPEIEVVQIQANYYDHFTNTGRDNGGSIESYEICRKYNKPVIIMEPVKGGNLARVDVHPEVKALFDAADPTQSAPAWALRYSASLPGVVTVLSGMSTLAQMEDNRRILLDEFKPLTEAENQMLAQAAKLIESKKPVGCTACHYCTDKGCPAGIRIPDVLHSLNMLSQYDNLQMARMQYYQATEQAGPSDCLDCGTCEAECPQRLPIRELLQESKEKLYAGENYDIWANHDVK